MKFGFDLPAVSEEKIFENGGQWIENGLRRMQQDGYTINSPGEPHGSVELTRGPMVL